MIVSDEFRYVFISTPHTACTAISGELCDLYGGETIFKKHTSAAKFLRSANRDERRYFFFTGIRNPLDATVTRYLKLKNNQNGMFTDPAHFAVNGGFITEERLKVFRFIQDNKASFSEYFSRFIRKPPYDGDVVLHNIETSDFLIRYENLQEDFSQSLKKLGITQIRPLPIINRTAGRTKSWEAYYEKSDIIRAKELYSQRMLKLGYSFPSGW